MGTSPSFDLDDGPPVLTASATVVRVYRYDPDAAADEEESAYTLLPNVRCDGVFERDGAEPATARFSYLLDNTLSRDEGWPCEFEDLWPMQGKPSKYRVKQDDRLVVLAELGEGDRRLLFDGFVTSPQADVSGDAQQVTFAATSVEVRCWDAPVGGRFQRNGDAPEDGDVVPTGLPTRFNPDGRPNCTPDGHDDDSIDDFPHPVFIQGRSDADDSKQSMWTLAKAAKYLLARCNDEEYVDNPDFSLLADLLNNRAPKDGDSYDPGDPATYDENPVTLSDYDCNNRPWPEVLGELLGYYGFGMRFVSELDERGEPWHHLELDRRDQSGPTEPKDLKLPKTGEPIDPDVVNVGAFHAAHDFHGVANEIEIETGPKLYEVSIVLAPGFEPAAGDQTAVDSAKFLKSALATATDEVRNKYRRYIADEIGEGHWSYEDAAWTEIGPIDLEKVFPATFDDDGAKVAGYVRRYRPGRRTLVTLDEAKRPLRASLHLSRDYDGPAPAVWDGSGKWQPITGSWELLDDRLGVYVTAEDPRQWNIGKYKGADHQSVSEKFNAVAPLAVPGDTEATKPFFLRLTTVIEGDFGIDAKAAKRKASPIGFTIRKRVDARDHYKWAAVDPSSANFGGDPDVPDQVVDGTDAANEKATQLRAAHEFPPIAGSITIPYLDFNLQIGDRVKSINGRGVNLQVNAGGEAGEAPSYPFIVARTYDCAGEQQSTVLQLSDRRTEPQPIGRRSG